MKEEKNPDQYQPVTDRAKAKAILWATEPQDEQAIRTFSNIAPILVYVFSAVQAIYNYKKQLMDSDLIINGLSEKEFEKKYPDGLPLGQQPKITFNLNKELIDNQTKALITEMLLLAPASTPRANLIIDMIKNMNRPAFNPMAMLGGMFGNKSETPVEDEDDYPTTIE